MMARAREIMTDWVVEALQQLGGRGSILEISRRVWDRHEPDIRAAKPRPYGLAAGEFQVPANFDEPLPADVLR